MAFTSERLTLWRTPARALSGRSGRKRFLFEFASVLFSVLSFPRLKSNYWNIRDWATVSHKPWSFEAAARLAVHIVLTLLFGMLLASVIDQAKFVRLSESGRDFAQLVVMTVFFQCSILFWVSRFLRDHGLTWRQTFFAGQPRRAAAIGAVAAVVTTPALMWILALLNDIASHLHLNPQAQELVQTLASHSTPVGTRVFVGVTSIALAPIAEETVFRGIMYPTLKQLGYPRLALWSTSLLFAASHFNLIAFLPLAILSIVLIWLYEATDNLAAPILTHCLFNTVNFILIVATHSTA